VLVRPLTNNDVAAVELTPGEVEWEVETRIGWIETSLAFVVAEDDGAVVGVAGLVETEEDGTVEVVCVYVRKDTVGEGVGRALIERIEADATALGFTTLLIVSGSRYREIGYPFWIRRYGEPAIDADFWGPGFDRAVWRHQLATPEN
jgi:GNAT superfamily N-acetyltransferase